MTYSENSKTGKMNERTDDGQICITHLKKKLVVCLMKNGRAERIACYGKTDPRAVPGTVLTGTVRKMIPSINAVFVDIGCGEDGFIQLSGKNDTRGLIDKGFKRDSLKCGDMLLVQVAAPPARGKPMDLTRSVCLTGRYAAVRAGSPGLHVSRRIDEEWKTRISGDRDLKEAAPDLSVMIRTNACPEEGFTGTVKVKTLSEIRTLSAKLREIMKAAPTRVGGSVLYSPPGFSVSFLQDVRDDLYSRVVTDVPEVYRELLPVLRDTGKDLDFYENKKIPLSTVCGLEKNLKELTSRTVYLKSGGSIVIEQTTALCAIDVNSGSKTGRGDRREAFDQVNREAMKEAAHQIIARNLSGIILIDLINADHSGEREELISFMRECLKDDPERAECIDITELGLMEIVRSRNLPPLSEQLGN